jgi:hypothetical protein
MVDAKVSVHGATEIGGHDHRASRDRLGRESPASTANLEDGFPDEVSRPACLRKEAISRNGRFGMTVVLRKRMSVPLEVEAVSVVAQGNKAWNSA